MKRGKPPVRRTPLRRDTPGARAFAEKRRKPIPKIGRKREREQPALDAFRDALRARSSGRCEAASLADVTGQRVCGRTGRHDGTDAHHLWPEDHDRGMHVPSRGLWLCRDAHRWAHEVATSAEASALGLLRPYELILEVGQELTTDEAIAIAQPWYAYHPEGRSMRIEWPLGRLVVPPPGIAVEWRT